MTEKFVFQQNVKNVAFALMGVGVLALILGIIMAATGKDGWTTERIWSAILTNNMYFLGLGLAGVFLVAAHYLAYGGWYVVLKRIPEAMAYFVPVAGILMLPVVIGAWNDIGWHDVYRWANPEYVAKDEIVAGKTPYLNMPFFTLRYLIYFAGWIFFIFMIRKYSLLENRFEGLGAYNKSKLWSALFIVFFAVTSSTMTWDFIMSIHTHWYSTLFGWYNFSSYLAGAIAVIILITVFLKMSGYLAVVTDEHLHDMGKLLFAFSIFWTYLWFCQYMLIWYANIGEATEYFRHRLDHYPFLFFFMAFINFVIPFLVLMSRDAKRRMVTLIIVSIVVFFGHWLDYFVMVTPSATYPHFSPLGFFDLGLMIGYTGLFIFVVLTGLAKAPLVAVNHPFYKESLQHHT